MPVVLTEDLDKLTQAKADDIRSALGNPFTSKTPTSSDSLTNPLGGGNGTASISPDASLPAPDAPPKLDGGNGLPAPSAPSTAPLKAPDPNAMLDRNGVIAYVHQRAADFDLDPAAVLSVANHEGLNTAPGAHWQLSGESNISFGPPSWYGNGAGSAILKEHGDNAAAWSWTPPGIDYWLSQVASAAKGLRGNQAISAIVHGFERPREDLADGEVKNAQADYAKFQPGGTQFSDSVSTAGNAATVAPNPTLSAGSPSDFTPSAASTPSSAPDLLDQATAFKNSLGNPFQSALDSAGSAKDNLLSQASAFKDALGSPFHDQNAGVMTASQQPTPSDSLTNPTMQANPTTPPIGSLTPPTPEPTVLDNIGSAVADNQANPPLKPLGDAIANSGANQLRHDVFPNIMEPGHPMNAPTTGSLTPEDSSLSLPMAFMGTGDVQAARDALPGLRVAVDALRSQFPQMSEGSLAASGAAKALAAAEKTIAEAPPEVPKTNGYASYPAPPVKPTTPEPAPQATTDVMQGMLDMLRKQGGHDPAQIDALQAQIDALKPPAPTVSVPATPVERITKPVADEPPIPATTDTDGLVQGMLDRLRIQMEGLRGNENGHVTGDEPPDWIYDTEGNKVPRSTANSDQSTNTITPPPPERYDPEAGKWVPDNSGNRTIDTYGNIVAGDHQIGSKAGPSAPYDKADAQVPGLHYDQATKGWVDGAGNPVDLTALGGAKPSKAASKGAPEPPPSKVISENTGRGEPTTPAPDPELYGVHGATPETVQAAHERINYSTGDQMAEHAALDDMLRRNANPAEVARFLAQVEGKSVGATDMLRTLRSGSMAGGDTTEAKVLLSPLIQTAMRAPVGAIKAIVKGKPSDVPKGMMGGIEGLADGTLDALQTLKYGINMRSALAGSAGGGFGHAPGIDVLGKNTAQRAAGTLALGLVRTHGAAADISAGIGRGAASATGATAAEATEAGQKWALRSGEYGTVGRAFSNAIQEVKNVNPVLDVVGQILVPFYRVGYNATVQGIERSPVGIVGTAADVARGKLPASAPSWLKGPYAEGAAGKAVTPVGDRLANNMFGVGLAAIGFSNAANGNLTGEHPTGNDPKWSVRVGGQWLPLRFLGGGGEALAQSAMLYEAARDGNGNVGRMAELSAAAYVAHVHDETWLRSVGDLLEMVGNDARNIGTSRDAQAKNDLGFKLGALAKSFEPQGTLIGQMATHIKDATNPDDGTSSGGRASRPSRPTRPSRPSR